MGNMIFNRRLMESNEAPSKYNFDNYDKNFVSEEKMGTVERRIFPQHMYGGPKGLGDPTYRYGTSSSYLNICFGILSK